MMQMAMEASELDAERRKAEEDKVAAAVSESKRAVEECEATATQEVIRRVQGGWAGKYLF